MDIAEAPAGQPPYTDGRIVYVSALRWNVGRPCCWPACWVQAVDPALVRPLRARTGLQATCRRRSTRTATLADRFRWPPGAPAAPKDRSAAESLEVAGSRVKVADPPPWFGVIKPLQIARVPRPQVSAPPTRTCTEIIAGAHDDDDQTDDEDDDGRSRRARSSSCSTTRCSPRAWATYAKLLGSHRAPPEAAAAVPNQARAQWHERSPGPSQAAVTRVHFVDAPIRRGGVGRRAPRGGRLQRCLPVGLVPGHRHPLTRAPTSPPPHQHDRGAAASTDAIGLGPKVLRRRPDGDLDTRHRGSRSGSAVRLLTARARLANTARSPAT